MKSYRSKLIFLSIIAVVLSLLLALSSAFIYKFISNEVDVVGEFFDHSMRQRALSSFLFFMLLIIFGEWFASLIHLFFQFVVWRLKFNYILLKEEEFLKKTIKMPYWQLVDIEKDTDLYTKLTVDLRGLANQRVQIITDSLHALFQSTSLILLSFYFNWAVGLSLLFLFIFSSIYSLLSKKVESARLVSSQQRRKYITRLEESLSNYQTFYFSSDSKIFNKRNEELSKLSLKAESKYLRINQLISLFQNSVNQLFRLFLLSFLGIVVYQGWFTGTLTIGMIASIFYYFYDLTYHSSGLVDNLIQLKSIKTLEREIDFKVEFDQGLEIDSELRELKIVDLDLNYGEQRIFKNFNLEIERGKRYAIIGRSGIGKSTLAKLLSGQLREFSGKIYFGFQGDQKVEIRELSSESLLKNISLLPPKNTVFEASIRENITLDSEENTDSNNQLLNRSLQLANIDFLSKEEGVETWVTGLSEGQKQRVNIASTLFHDRPIIIFDESLSNLDDENIKKIKQNFLTLKDKTFILIGHRFNKDDPFFDAIIDLENLEEHKPKTLNKKGD